MPEKALTAIYRAKFRDGLEGLRLKDKVPVCTWRTPWCVDIEPVGSGKAALKYLTPYIFRVAISNRNILAVDDKQVTFKYRDAKTNRYKQVTLPADQFIHRFLQHVLPKGFQKVRTYGLYHPKQRCRLKLVKEQLEPRTSEAVSKDVRISDTLVKSPVRFYCPCCKVEMIRIGKINSKRGPPI